MYVIHILKTLIDIPATYVIRVQEYGILPLVPFALLQFS
jgi:hypothetical protein